MQRIQERYGLKSRYDGVRETGSDREIAQLLGISTETVHERAQTQVVSATLEIPTDGSTPFSRTAT